MTTIGQYEILEVIGDGGMGTVYKARDPRFDRLVAIKVLHAHFQRDAGVVERFKTEAVVQAKLQHPHIVTVYDFLATSEVLAIVMEFVEGRPLNDVIRQARGPLPLAWVLQVLGQVLGAVGYAHDKGLVHRDLKPSNILVGETGGEPWAKLTDFGITKVLGNEKMRTATGAKMGTLGYMAPEQLRSPKLVDRRSDIYALGATLYEMLTGAAPFDGDTEYELMRRIVEVAVPPARDRRPDLPKQLDRVIERAMAKEPGARYASCADMKAEISAGHVPVAALQSQGVEPFIVSQPSGRAEASTTPVSGTGPVPVERPQQTGARTQVGRLAWIVMVAFVVVAAAVGLIVIQSQQRALQAERQRLAQEVEARDSSIRRDQERQRADADTARQRAAQAERRLREIEAGLKAPEGPSVRPAETSVPGSSEQTASTIPDGLIAHYSLDGGAANLAGGAFHGALRNGPTPVADRFGNPTGALMFERARQQWVEVSERWFDDSGSAATLAAWINLRNLDRDGGEIVFSCLGRGVYLFYRPEDRTFVAGVRNANGSGYDMVSGTIPGPGWHFVTGVWHGSDDGRLTLWIDGARAAERVFHTRLNENDYSSGIGGDGYHKGNFEGVLDDVWIFRTALDEPGITALFNRPPG